MSNNVSLVILITALAGVAYGLTTDWGQEKWTLLSTWVMKKDILPLQNITPPVRNTNATHGYIKVRGDFINIPQIFIKH
jgi:hypothetical protein